MTCQICDHQIIRLVAEMYRRLGVHKSVSDYPDGHYDRTKQLVTDLFSHMAKGSHTADVWWPDQQDYER